MFQVVRVVVRGVRVNTVSPKRFECFAQTLPVFRLNASGVSPKHFECFA